MPVFCERCSFWSDQFAEHRDATMFAICLNPNSAKYGTFTGERDGCGRFVAGEPIDSYRLKAETKS